MTRKGFAHDFAHSLDRDTAVEAISRSHEALGRHLRLVGSQERLAAWQARLSGDRAPAVVIDQPPASVSDAWRLAGLNAAYAATLLWQALRLSAIAAPSGFRSAWLRAKRPLPAFGVCGWAYGIFLTALLIWR